MIRCNGNILHTLLISFLQTPCVLLPLFLIKKTEAQRVNNLPMITQAYKVLPSQFADTMCVYICGLVFSIYHTFPVQYMTHLKNICHMYVSYEINKSIHTAWHKHQNNACAYLSFPIPSPASFHRVTTSVVNFNTYIFQLTTKLLQCYHGLG